jgi:hypothetical protein
MGAGMMPTLTRRKEGVSQKQKVAPHKGATFIFTHNSQRTANH